MKEEGKKFPGPVQRDEVFEGEEDRSTRASQVHPRKSVETQCFHKFWAESDKKSDSFAPGKIQIRFHFTGVKRWPLHSVSPPLSTMKHKMYKQITTF